MKFKFKITDETTVEDALNELENLCNAPVNELPFNHIVKIAEFLGAELQRPSPPGSMERFRHPSVKTFGGYFGVHIIHKGKNESLIQKVNFKKYLYPFLVEIIKDQKEK
ncbi:MAG: hypothetical protein Q8904_09780 [Bacteroidota bacterium]|nr:hypothetical protein [Bacteroidota bacterium]